jgi:hypothetical protein
MANRIALLKVTFLFILINALGIFPVFAQNRTSEDLWVCPVFESGLYSVLNAAIGGGAALGYGDKVVFGLKVIYWNDMEDISELELNFFLRFYLFSPTGKSGFFIQLNGGPVIFYQSEESIAVPSEIGTVSGGLSLGWRFLLGGHFFIEPAIRAGYPYIVLAGLSAGLRF